MAGIKDLLDSVQREIDHASDRAAAMERTIVRTALKKSMDSYLLLEAFKSAALRQATSACEGSGQRLDSISTQEAGVLADLCEQRGMREGGAFLRFLSEGREVNISALNCELCRKRLPAHDHDCPRREAERCHDCHQVDGTHAMECRLSSRSMTVNEVRATYGIDVTDY